MLVFIVLLLLFMVVWLNRRNSQLYAEVQQYKRDMLESTAHFSSLMLTSHRRGIELSLRRDGTPEELIRQACPWIEEESNDNQRAK